MKLYYCFNCGAVFAFNIYDIRKHELTLPCEYGCRVCGVAEAFQPVGEDDKIADAIDKAFEQRGL